MPSFESMKLLPGQPLELEIEGYTHDRDRCVLVGYKPGSSIVVTTPVAQGRPIPVRTNMAANVRLFANKINGACAFKTEVIHVSITPYPHLHLAMPEELVMGEVRKAARARAEAEAAIEFKGKRSSGEILDLSVTGAGVRVPIYAFEMSEVISVKTTLDLGVAEQTMELEGIIRSVTMDEQSQTTVLGVEWHNVEKADLIALQAFVASKIDDTPF